MELDTLVNKWIGGSDFLYPGDTGEGRLTG